MQFIQQLWALFVTKLDIYKNIATLFKLEAQLAKLNVVPLMLNILFILPILLGLWINIMLLLGYVFFLVLDNLALSIFLVLFFNLLACALLFININRHLNKMCFKKTRYYLNLPEDEFHELNKGGGDKHFTDGKELN